eukprot:gene18882-26737_t
MDAKQEVTVCGKPSRPFVPEDLSMPLRLRKLIGTLIIIFLVITYALLATTFAEIYLGASACVQLSRIDQMRVAVIADIHGNHLALEAVLSDIAQQGINDVINLGDCFSGPLNS